ncbi:hypothetical protein IAR55_005677 [Kwoniella newhampshirensis]|uniref:Glycosyltransferase family 18 catalytic domain-containing protein n=1 Tax=Kwoniella newhampshirensis TaxID=1651941 RepID=A0AAW0YYA1_9TREE
MKSMALAWLWRHKPLLRLCICLVSLTLLVPRALFIHHGGRSLWDLQLEEENTERLERITRIRDLRAQLNFQWPGDGSFRTYSHVTLQALDRLADCMTEGTCGPREETVIILGSYHFGHSQSGHTSGEDIWASSLIEIMHSLNYTLLYTYEPLESLLVHQALDDLVSLVFMESQGVSQCIDMGSLTKETAATRKPPIVGLQWIEGEEQLGCAKRVGFEQGIPLWKIRPLHFWYGTRHPLPGWTLSPENYTGWEQDTNNYYLGYYLPHCINAKSHTHERRAFILGKRPEYFADGRYAWPRGILPDLAEKLGDFKFAGGAGKGGAGVDMGERGIENIGQMDKATWTKEVAKSAVVLGIGSPPLSPSPYDAMCVGVPFINPITRRDAKDPENRIKWRTQHDALRDFDPPYVYHVDKDDVEGLRNALQSALDTPFMPYIPERMLRENVQARLVHLIENDWKEVAMQIVASKKTTGWYAPDLGAIAHSNDGLLF